MTAIPNPRIELRPAPGVPPDGAGDQRLRDVPPVREATAERLVRLYLAQVREQDALLGEVEAEAPEGFLAARTMVGLGVGETWLEVLAPLLRAWPNLRPSWLDASPKDGD